MDCKRRQWYSWDKRRGRPRASSSASAVYCIHSWQWRIQGSFLVARKHPPPGHDFFVIRGVTPLRAPNFTSLLNLRLLETPLETNSGYAKCMVESYYSCMRGMTNDQCSKGKSKSRETRLNSREKTRLACYYNVITMSTLTDLHLLSEVLNASSVGLETTAWGRAFHDTNV